MAAPLDLVAQRRVLQLETLYDLLVALHGNRSEEELVEDLLERVCAVLDPAAAVVVTRGAQGHACAAASVGWLDRAPDGETLLEDAVWHELLVHGRPLERRDGSFAGRSFQHLLIAPLQYRSTFQGYLAVLDKERRDGDGDGAGSDFSDEDLRFLVAVAALAGVTLDGLRQVATLVAASERLAEENKVLRDKLVDEVDGQRIVAHSPEMRRVLERVERVGPRSVSVLVRGESGTGKELVAKLLHLLSGRSGPLIALNCSAMPESLIESELFGIEGGVATGVRARAGQFELASGGTLFLDEIGDLHSSVQVKLLRALQEREIVHVGGNHSIAVDVRLVAATHHDVESLIEEGVFREDLYYRLKGVEVLIPPLRDRREDVPHLVHHFSEEFCKRESIQLPVFERDALELLLHHDYPGNVRELQNLVEAAVSLADSRVDGELVQSLLGSSTPARPEALDLATVEQHHIRRVLDLVSGNKSAAARILGLDRRTLQRKGF